MRSGDHAPFGGNGGVVEVDETFIGRIKGMPKQSYHHKMKVLALIDRSTGKSRSMVVDNVHPNTIMPLVRENIDRESIVMTDEAAQYVMSGWNFAVTASPFIAGANTGAARSIRTPSKVISASSSGA